MDTTPQQLLKLEAELKGHYLAIADRYKAMSKVKDNYRLNVTQDGINQQLKQVAELRGRIDALRKQIVDEWEVFKAKDGRVID